MRSLIILVLLGAAMAVPRNVQRIIGGETTTIQRYPFMANMESFRWNLFWTQWCGGTLITTTSVLSAAHCYDDSIISEWRVRLGSTTTTGGTLHAISAFVLHERYDIPTRLDNDVSIVRLATPAVLSPEVGVARIAGTNYVLPDDTAVYVLGWGTTFVHGPHSTTLRHVQVYTINQELCAERYAYLKSLPGYGWRPDVTPGMICTGILDVGGKDACQGDSGGPVVHQDDVVIGITSWGYGCGHRTYPGVNARVSYYTNWIVNHA